MPGPSALSTVEIDWYSAKLSITSGLNANGWSQDPKSVDVRLVENGWPSDTELALYNDAHTDLPRVIVLLSMPNNSVAGFELGSNGKKRDLHADIYAYNEALKLRLAEEIVNLVRDDGLKVYDFTTPSSPTATTERYAVDELTWRAIPAMSTAPDVDKHRAVVRVVYRRAD